MRVKDIIRSEKRSVSWEDWKSGPMPRKSFPLSKVRSRKYSFNSYRWRIGQFFIGNQEFRVLVAFREDIQQYYAHLGSLQDSDMVVLVSYEFHGTHPGWHIHAACGKEQNVVPGRYRTPEHLRVPRGKSVHRRIVFDVTETNATEIAGKAFGMFNTPGGLI